MYIPFWLRSFLTIKTFSIQPKSTPLHIFGAKIVAGEGFFFAPPPFGGYAFGAFDGGDVMQDAAPAEAQRRAVRHAGHSLYGFRPAKQA